MKRRGFIGTILGAIGLTVLKPSAKTPRTTEAPEQFIVIAPEREIVVHDGDRKWALKPNEFAVFERSESSYTRVQ
jgi:hypothetical protein